MPTTREVEAARVERMRRAAAAREQAPARPAPRNARERRRLELEEQYRAQRGPRWACRLDGCALAHVWHPASSSELAEQEARRHYMTRHYNPEPPYALRGLSGDSA
jgi:hypothetical protein